MRNKLKQLLYLIALSIASSAIAQVDSTESTYWIRPVIAPNDTAKVNEFKKNGVTYYLPAGIYVQVAGKNNGDVILGGVRLATDTEPVTVASKKRQITQAEFDKAEALKGHLSVINDSLLAIDLKDVEGEGHIDVYVKGERVSSQPAYGKNDTLGLQTLGIKNAEGVIILAQDSLLSTYAKVQELRKTKMDLSLTATTEKDDTSKQPLPWWMILAISALIAVLVAVVILIIKKGRAKGRVDGRQRNKFHKDDECKNASEKEHQKTQSNQDNSEEPTPALKTTTTPISSPEPVEPETIEEKVARLEKEVDKLNSNLKIEKNAKEKVQRELDTVRGKLYEEQEKREEKIRKEVEYVRKECDKRITSANDRAEKAENKANTIADNLNKKFDEERKKVQEEKKRLNEKLDATSKELQTTAATLRTTEDSLYKANRKVENLTSETESFHKHLSGVPDSKTYCNDIVKLLALAKKVQESAAALLKADIEDKYYIFKALALYTGKLDTINLTSFYADVEMISKTGFVIKGTPLATYDPNLPNAELHSLTKNYFFTTYLKTYFDALVVLNESMAGLNYLMDDVTPADLTAFAGYRSQIEAVAKKLGINILTVKIYDAAGSNTDLLATEVDAGIEKHGAILEIENCKVSLIGGAPNNERIIVKIQK